MNESTSTTEVPTADDLTALFEKANDFYRRYEETREQARSSAYCIAQIIAAGGMPDEETVIRFRQLEAEQKRLSNGHWNAAQAYQDAHAAYREAKS